MKKTMALMVVACVLMSCQESLEERCAREARNYTEKKCPAPINEFTIIDSMTFDRSTHTMEYHYTMRGPADDASKYADGRVYDLLLSELKNATSVKEFKDAGYNFKYTYRSESERGRVLYTATFSKEDYR